MKTKEDVMKDNKEKKLEPKWSERKKVWIVYCDKNIYGKRFRFTPSFKKLSESEDFLKFWLALGNSKQNQVLTKEIKLSDTGWKGKHIKSFSRS